MADGVAITAGSGTTILTDDCGASGHAQGVKIAYSADGVATLVLVDANGIAHQGAVAEDLALAGNPVRQGMRASTAVPTAMSADGDVVTPWASRSGAQNVVPRVDQLLITVTPTIDTAVYATGDRVGTVMTFAAAAIGNGRTGTVTGAVLTDRALSAFDIDMVLFQNTPTLVNADNGAFDVTDANKDTALPLGWINFSTANSYSYAASNRDVIGTSLGGPIQIPYTCGASDTAIYGVLVARGAYDAASTTDLIVYLTVVRD